MALEPVPLNLRVAPDARSRIVRFVASIDRPDAVATLMFDTNKRWSIGAYYRENIDGLTPEYEKNGWPLLHSCDGLTLAIPQWNLVPILEGRTLDFAVGDGYVIV